MVRRFLASKLVVLAVLVGLALADTRSEAASLVDTGPGGTSSIGADSLFNDGTGSGSFQFLAGQFDLSNGAVVNQLEGWMGPFSFAGDIEVKLYSDIAGLPGDVLYSKLYSVAFRNAAGWEPFSGFDAAVPAGTYWLSFEPTASGGFNGTMPAGAPSPLPKYVFSSDGNPGFLNLGHSLGMRVDGEDSEIIMGAAARASYREDVPINGDPNGLSAQDGGNGRMSVVISVGNGAGRGGMIPDGLEAGALARGFTDAPNPVAQHSGTGTGHGVSWRPFFNSASEDRTFRISGVLEGGANNSFGVLNCQVDVRISALDPEILAQSVQSSGGDAATYLLDKHTAAGHYAAFPAAAVYKDYTLYDQFNADDSGYQPRNRDLDTDLFTVGPGESFILVFDVYAQTTGASFGGGEGELDYINTLRPAANLFTDGDGQPVTDIVAGSSQSVPEPAFGVLTTIGVLAIAWRSGPSQLIALGVDPAVRARRRSSRRRRRLRG
jgi:hypothetical protein